jgi:hypothetical protein
MILCIVTSLTLSLPARVPPCPAAVQSPWPAPCTATAWESAIIENFWEPVPGGEDFVSAEGTTKPYRIEIVGAVCDAYVAITRGIR